MRLVLSLFHEQFELGQVMEQLRLLHALVSQQSHRRVVFQATGRRDGSRYARENLPVVPVLRRSPRASVCGLRHLCL